MKKEKSLPDLTEKEAALVYARAVNRLDPSEFNELLATDAIMESMWVTQPMQGKENIAPFLTEKWKNIQKLILEDPVWKVTAELAIASPVEEPGNYRPGFAFHSEDSPDPSSFEVMYFDERPCVLITQGENIATAVFVVEGPYIKRFDLIERRFYSYKQSGIFPE
jgi:hypothetical protein